MLTETPALETHRVALTGHCYRMLGSPSDADDAVQEVMVRAWSHRERFEGGRPALPWLYRVATNVCLDMLRHSSRKTRPIEAGPRRTVHDALETRPRSHWLEPVPDARVLPEEADPAERLALKQSVRLAFVAALQHLPPKQRATLLLAEVLGWPATEVADALDTSVPAVNSALQRARAVLAERDVQPAPAELTPAQEAMLQKYLEAFERYDVDALSALMREDATLSMPPYDFWLQGHAAIKDWLLGRGAGCRGSRLLRVMANGVPAFAQFRADPAGGHRAWALMVLEVEGDRFRSLTSFLEVDALFPLFGLPLVLPA